jgi:hypothetical protein
MDDEVAQRFVDVQVAPALQALQALEVPVQTPPVQAAPGARNVSTHTGPPLWQLTVEVAVHGPEAAQAAPSEQAVHVPAALQTPVADAAVQGLPTAPKVRSVQTGAPEEHSMVAVRAQGLAEAQLAPCVHAAHWPPPSHTPAAPPEAVQVVPIAAKAASVHTGAPLAQAIAAEVAQGLVEVQGAPVTHGVQVPLASQTPAPPPALVHDVPTGEVVSTVHTGPLAVQVIAAVAAHGLDETQAPLQRRNCQLARMVPFCEPLQSMV